MSRGWVFFPFYFLVNNRWNILLYIYLLISINEMLGFTLSILQWLSACGSSPVLVFSILRVDVRVLWRCACLRRAIGGIWHTAHAHLTSSNEKSFFGMHMFLRVDWSSHAHHNVLSYSPTKEFEYCFPVFLVWLHFSIYLLTKKQMFLFSISM